MSFLFRNILASPGEVNFYGARTWNLDAFLFLRNPEFLVSLKDTLIFCGGFESGCPMSVVGFFTSRAGTNPSLSNYNHQWPGFEPKLGSQIHQVP